MRLPDLLPVLAGMATVAYPFVVYFGLPYLPPGLMVAVAVGIGAVHFLRKSGDRLLSGWSFLFIACVLVALLALRPVLAMQAYPPILNLCLAATFGWSLFRPPTAIERIARLRRPNLPPDAVAYTRGVTWMWTIFFLANACVASICALFFSVAIWTLWNGFIAYIVIGALFAGELMVRRWRMRRAPT
jgi:uncharacterized membrane protein